MRKFPIYVLAPSLATLFLAIGSIVMFNVHEARAACTGCNACAEGDDMTSCPNQSEQTCSCVCLLKKCTEY